MLETKLYNSKNEFGVMANLPHAQIGEKQNAPFVSEMQPGIEETDTLDVSEEMSAKQNAGNESLYFCQHLTDGAKHPGIIIETAGLASIKPSRPTYRPRLPVEVLTSGKISEIQLERIIYARQAHESRLPISTARTGISVGDGTGVGKTGTILGIILENWFSGRKRTVWFSVKFDLIKAVKDEMFRLGFRVPIQLINDYKPEEQITMSKGIVFCTY